MKKILIALCAALAASVSLSIAVSAAEIEKLSVSEGVVSALIFGKNVRIYFAAENDGDVTKVVSAKPDADGFVEMNIGENTAGKLYLWEDGTVTPLSLAYTFKDGRAYAEGSQTPVPEFDCSDNYIFDHTMNVVIVSSVSEKEIKGIQNGAEVSFPLAEDVEVIGYASALSEIQAGDIILPALNKAGICGKIDVMMTVSMKSNGNMDYKSITEKFGTHNPADGSAKELNVVAQYVTGSLSQENAAIKVKDGTKNVEYRFESAQSPYSRLIVATVDKARKPVVKFSTISGERLFLDDEKRKDFYYNYLFMRVDAETGLVKEAVLICPKTTLGEFAAGGDGWSGLYSLEE